MRLSGCRPWTNELTSLQAGASGLANNRQDLGYDWDSAGNLTLRQDVAQGLTESFGYDALNRLHSTSGTASPSLTIDYDESGNIQSKSDVGSYTYHATKKHAVTAAGPNTFDYDGNGNATTRNGLSQSFASFDLPTLLRTPSYQSELSYGPRHQRWKQVASYTNGTETTHYVGGLLDKVTATSTGVTYWRHYVPTPGDATVVVSRNSNLTGSTRYVLTDHLGGTDAVLDEYGNTVLRESFDAFGKRRGSNWNAGTAPDWATIGNTTRDGYTGHEMLDGVGLIHMNGRVYDPTVGRFLSVDPIIGDLADSQSVNPYAYVGNQPLSYTDPSGYDACTASCAAIVYSVIKTAINFLGGGPGPPPPKPMALPGQSGQIGGGQCGPGASSAACTGLILYAGAPGSVDPSGVGPGGDLTAAHRADVVELLSQGAVMIGGAIVIGATPGLGESLDLYILIDPNSTGLDRLISVGSLGINLFTGGVAPNAAAFILARRASAARGLSHWGNPKTLARHFRDHGADFGAKSADDYARQASDFFRRSQADRLPTKIDADGVTRVYDPRTNTFGSFNPDGTTRTFFKPTSPTYSDRQPGGAPWGP